MTDQGDLWTAVKTSYDSDGLITLTNIRDRSQTAIDDTVGTDAALEVINLWPLYAEATYDGTNDTHVAVAKRAVIAVLWQRGGTSSAIAKVEWDEVFGDEGTLVRIKRTGARGQSAPSSNSGVSQTDETMPGGRAVLGWADRDALPSGILPTRREAT